MLLQLSRFFSLCPLHPAPPLPQAIPPPLFLSMGHVYEFFGCSVSCPVRKDRRRTGFCLLRDGVKFTFLKFSGAFNAFQLGIKFNFGRTSKILWWSLMESKATTVISVCMLYSALGIAPNSDDEDSKTEQLMHVGQIHKE